MMNRKQFIDKIFRYGIVGGFILLAGYLLLKREVTVGGISCAENTACKKCKKYQSCNLPEKS